MSITVVLQRGWAYTSPCTTFCVHHKCTKLTATHELRVIIEGGLLHVKPVLSTWMSVQERAHYALKHIGGEVLNGAFTTWLAIIVLAGARHYIFQSFFKLLFALVVLAIWCVCMRVCLCTCAGVHGCTCVCV